MAHYDREEYKVASDDFNYEYLCDAMGRYCKKTNQEMNQRDFEHQLALYMKQMGGKKPTMANLVSQNWAAPGKGKEKGKGQGKDNVKVQAALKPRTQENPVGITMPPHTTQVADGIVFILLTLTPEKTPAPLHTPS